MTAGAQHTGSSAGSESADLHAGCESAGRHTRLHAGSESAERMLVLGMGAFAFGRERRAVRMLERMRRVEPFFLISKWEDGNVSGLLERHGFAYAFSYARAPFGYLGRARLWWTLVTLIHLPVLLVNVLSAYGRRSCRSILLLDLGAFVNALPAILVLKAFGGSRLNFYLGDTPTDRAVNRLVGRLIDATADCVVVNSEAVRRGLVAIGVAPDRVEVVYNGVDLERFGNAAGAADAAGADRGDPADTILVGFVGQFTENKGIEDFLDAAVLAARSDPRCRFVLVGEVNEMDPFQVQLPAMIRRRQIDDRVHITGWMDDVAPVYAEMDVLVVPSRHEDPAPNTNIEAMACGVPIVATRVGGTPELVADGETAYLVDRLSPEQLAERILELAVDASARRRMGQAGRARAERLFDADRNAAAVERLLTGESAAHAVVREEA